MTLDRSARGPNARLLKRSLTLFANFFLIILAYYQVKVVSRSLLIEFGGAEWFPYVWVYSAFALLGLIGFYHRLVERYSRVRIVLGSLLAFAGLLMVFRPFLAQGDIASAIAFYLFVDIFSVVLVEQFWSLTDSISAADEAKRTYWFVGTGGLLGGVAGGLIAGYLLKNTPLNTIDLLYTCAATLLITLVFNLTMWRAGLYREVRTEPPARGGQPDWRVFLDNRYLALVAALVCLSQLAQPVIEYQFIYAIDRTDMTLDARTSLIGKLFSVVGLIAIAVNLILTPLIHRRLGIFAGLMVQPLLIAVSSFGFYLHSTLNVAVVMKVCDRGLSYSINRASKEQLYIPVDPVRTYQAKAWIDMLGYRLFKVFGSGLILIATQWLPISLKANELTLLTFLICSLWVVTIGLLAQSHQRYVAARRVVPGSS